MSKNKKVTIEVRGTAVTILSQKEQDYICLTDIARYAIKKHIIPATVTQAQAAIVYANGADMLNVALFGQTAKQWRDANPDLDGNMRDHAAIEQLLVLANLEGMNAELIRMGLSQGERLRRLNEIAIRQMQALTANPGARWLDPPARGTE